MTTLTTPHIGHNYSHSSADSVIQMDSLSGSMLKFAVTENSLHLLWGAAKIVVSFLLVCLWALLVNEWLQVNVFAAWSASVAVLYIANLADATRLRDVVSLIVPAAFIWSVLAYDSQNLYLVGLTLFSHSGVAFFACLSRTSGSLREVGVWPVLLGSGLAMLILFVFLYLA